MNTFDDLPSAMLAIYFHSEVEADDLPDNIPEDAMPMPLARAIKIVKYHTELGSFERLRCAARILATSTIVEGVIQEVSTRRALAALDVDVESFENFLAEYQSAHSDEPLLPELLMILFYQFWKLEFTAACVPELISNDVGFDSLTKSTLVHYRARVQRPFGEAREALDPQNWDSCSAVFKNAYIAAASNTGEYEVDYNYDGYKHPTPSAPGSGWNDVLFEHYEMSYGWYSVWYRNFIDIETTQTATEFSYHYLLRKSIRSYLGPSYYWENEVDGGLNRDEGFFRLLVDPHDANSVIFEGFKLIRMSDRGYMANSFLNTWMSVFLRYMADETMAVACDCHP